MKKIPPLFFVITTLLGSCASENAQGPTQTAPQITTNTSSNITLTSSTSGGTITSDGGAEITAKGVVWNTTSSPTISLATKTMNGSGAGSFLCSITNLSPSTTYYLRAYATNSVGTGYGNEISFTTNAVVLPSISTSPIIDISKSSAVTGGTITNDGGGTVTARGVVWNTTQNPTIVLSTKTNDGTSTGTFTSTISNLESGTKYYVRSYATNSAGTVYGNEFEFETLPEIKSGAGTVFDADGNVYQTVDINGQVWMTENLKTTKYCNGDAISNVNFSQWDGLTTGAWTYYDNNTNNNDKYGKLYNWYSASSDKNACPCGFRVATKEDWTALSLFLGVQTAGKEIKSTGTVEDQTGQWHTSSEQGTNSVGFNALPSGWGDLTSSNFVFQNYKTGFWCSNSLYGKSAEYIQLDYNYPDFYFTLKDKNSAMAIRCIKN